MNKFYKLPILHVILLFSCITLHAAPVDFWEGSFVSNIADVSTVSGVSTTSTIASEEAMRFDANLQITKVAGVSEVFPGGNITYNITVTNTGTSTANDLVVTDQLDASLTFVSANSGGTHAAGLVTWEINNLAAGASRSLTLVVNVSNTLVTGDVVSNTASVSSPDFAAGPVSSAASTVNVVERAVIEIYKISNVIIVQAGGEIVYSISVFNEGPNPAKNVIIRDPLPEGTAFVSASNGGTLSAGVVSWNIPQVLPGETMVVQLRVRVDPNLREGTIITNNANASSTTDLASPKSSNDVEVSVLRGITPILGVTKQADRATVPLGENISYTIRVSNTGNTFATGVTITDTLPAGTSFVSANFGGSHQNGIVTWNIGIISPGQTLTLTIVVNVSGNLAGGTQITNTAVVASLSDPETPLTSDPSIVVVEEPFPIIQITKRAASTEVIAGNDLVYTITVRNVGTAPAASVVVTDDLPEGTTFVSANAGGVHNAGIVTWNLGTINPGQSQTLTVTVNVRSDIEPGTIIRNVAVVESPDIPDPIETDPDPENEVVVEVVADLRISKAATTDSIRSNTQLTYIISVSNVGSSNAQQVRVTDQLPTNTTFVFADNGGTHNSGTVTWEIPTIAAGTSIDLQLVVLVGQLNDGDQIRNVAVVTSPTDPEGPEESDPDIVIIDNRAPELNIVKNPQATEVVAGQNFSYTIVVSNTGTAPARDVVVTDALPAGLTFVSADNGGTHSAGTVTWNIPILAIGQSVTLSLVVNLNSNVPAGTSIRNVAVVDSPDNPEDPIPSDEDPGSDTEVEVEAIANLAITKAVSQSNVVAGAPVTYSLTISNSGLSDALTVLVRDLLPVGTSFISADNGGALNNGAVIWTIPVVKAGEQVTVNVTVATDPNLITGDQIFNIGQTSSPTDPDGTKESNTVVVTIDNAAEVTEIEVIKTVSEAKASPGDVLTYTITVTNIGTAIARNIQVTDQLPEGLMPLNVSNNGVIEGQTVSWVVPEIAPGEQVALTLEVMVTQLEGSVVNTVVVEGNNFEEEQYTSEPVTINEIDLRIVKEVNKTAVATGNEQVYRLTVTNISTTRATLIKVEDILPIGVTYIEAIATKGTVSFESTSRTLSVNITELNPQESSTITIRVKAEAIGEIFNTASVSANEKDADEENNFSTVSHRQLDLKIPNVFTPNGDGINDFWEIEALDLMFPDNDLVIVNRWGVEVFKVKGYKNDWNAGNLEQGTYFYQLSIVLDNGQREVFKGYLTVLR
jgi:uncharacterized repeat protein (TIGR01451 family)/gliding motility-associated-like protein